MSNNNFLSTFNYKLIYIFRINDTEHKGYLKIGEAKVRSSKKLEELTNNCEDLIASAKKRINEYTVTAGVVYELLHTEVAVDNKGNRFRDYNVHDVLENSGFEKHVFDTEKKQNDWFEVDLETAKLAIKACIEGKESLNANQITKNRNPIIFRPEQKAAIEETLKQFKFSDRKLWNAKMRFGKTLTALEIAKRSNFKKTIIITHKPAVSKGWFEDYNKIFYDTSEWLFGSKTKGHSIEKLVEYDKNFIYFASLQDLGGSIEVGGKYDKNKLIFEINWDFVVIDEAHEGTLTKHGTNILSEIIKKNNGQTTKVLELSGTPFNLLDNYTNDEIYTWDYVMEQEAKEKWNLTHFGDPNPYEDLPRLNIYTYNLNKIIVGYEDIEDKAFNFKEFFRTWTGNIDIDRKSVPTNCKIGDFVHENDVKSFINLISKKDNYSNYPYSRDDYRDYFRHSLWMLPGVKEAKALSKLLKQHEAFSQFKIINVAGAGDEEKRYDDALKAVEDGIGKHPEETYTITLSCGKLTAGVSVKPWTAVFMLSGTHSTSASSYLQTIFRVQTPANIGGKAKEECYVFDFAPDRTLKMISQAGRLSGKPGSINESRAVMGKLLNYCPVIAVNGSSMKTYDVSSMLQQLKKAYATRVVKNGFDDTKMYNDNLLNLNDIELKQFQELQKIVGSSKQTKRIDEIEINDQGFTNEEHEIIELESKKKNGLTAEEKQKLEELKKKKDAAAKAISILRGISIRIPLLIFGANIPANVDITSENFIELVDDDSWLEFMPRGVTKKMFKAFAKYYDPEIFIEAGRQIRNTILYADSLLPEERVKKIADLFRTFKNPDKETVLTPWKTVNMHMSNTLGGYTFFKKDIDGEYSLIKDNPVFIDQGEVTKNCLSPSSKILELNSKTGLYPLYLTYSIYKQRTLAYDHKKLDEDLRNELWIKTLKENIYVLCKTKMAKHIVYRTLAGYQEIDLNIIDIPDITKKLKDESDIFCEMINNPNTWKKDGIEMKFDAIVGNPPYQEILGDYKGTVGQANPVYNLFVENATRLTNRYISMITPSLWMTGGTGLNEFRNFMLKENHITILHDYEICDNIFSNVNIAGGVSYFLWDNTVTGKTKDYYYRKNGQVTISTVNMAADGNNIFIRDRFAKNILKKINVYSNNFDSFENYISTVSPFAKGATGKYDNLYQNEKTEDSIIMYRFSRNRDDKYAYVRRQDIIANSEWIDKHKVYISKAGEISAKFNGLPFYGAPGTACSETYLLVGPFETKEICMNVMKYMNTSLYKYLISQIKKTQNAARGVYKYVPVQDFTKNSDINWNSSLSNIEKEIFEKYKLTEEEITYIKNIVN